MAAPLLTIDRGNSTLDCALAAPGTPGVRRRCSPADAASLRDLVRSSGVRTAVGLSVVPGGLQAVRSVLADVGISLAIAGEDLPCPLEIRYHAPGSLGVDRWVAALAAWREHGAAIVVDCGTAVTVDAVSAEGTFLGGAIAPGPGVMARALVDAAPVLPLADLERSPGDGLPSSSQEAVNAGVVLGFCGAVERLVAAVDAAAGLGERNVVMTGGHAASYRRHGLLECIQVPDLVHRGLRHLWMMHRQRD